MSPIILGTLLIVLFASSAFGGVVPLVQHNNVLVEPVNDTTYKLSIFHDGGLHTQTVQQVEPGELLVKGNLRQTFYTPYGSLVVTYEAGRNGYVVKYSFETKKGEVMPTVVRLPITCLKLCTG